MPEATPGKGHNSKVGGVSAERLKSLVERAERIDEEIKSLQSDRRDIFSEAKGGGFDTKTMREMIKLRKMDAADRDEQELLRDTYGRALGIFA